MDDSIKLQDVAQLEKEDMDSKINDLLSVKNNLHSVNTIDNLVNTVWEFEQSIRAT